MNAVVFCGPTISAEEVRREMEAVCLPPAGQGDVYRAALDGPAMIGIIDGYFRQVPAVWHKEILWAMSRGIAVFGSASMGALRAAELAAFGMIGVGRVFGDYARGAIEDDDEVALAHATAEFGYRSLSEPMVNIRYTLRRAESEGILGPGPCETLIAQVKRIPYPQRSFECVLDEAGGLGGGEEALRAWLPANRIDQKREDAVMMLRMMRRRLESRGPAPEPRFHFHHTAAWQNLVSESRAAEPDESVAPELLLEELYLAGGDIAGAFARRLALADASRKGCRVGAAEAAEAELVFRSQRGLVDDAALARWLQSNELSRERFREFVAEEWVLGRTESPERALDALANHLRSTGAYPAMAARAARKQAALAARGMGNPHVRETGLDARALLEWYLMRIPQEPESYQSLLKLAQEDAAVLLRAAAREYIYASVEACGAVGQTTPEIGKIQVPELSEALDNGFL